MADRRLYLHPEDDIYEELPPDHDMAFDHENANVAPAGVSSNDSAGVHPAAGQWNMTCIEVLL